MFLGHFGLAMGVKRWTDDVSLGVLILAAQWADLVWPPLVLAVLRRTSFLQPMIAGLGAAFVVLLALPSMRRYYRVEATSSRALV